MSSVSRLILAAGLAVTPTLFATSGSEAPEYVAPCYSPIVAAPPQLLGANNSPRVSAVAWNGQEYGTFYFDKNTFNYYFRRVYADGTPAATPVYIANAGNAVNYRPALVWTGSDFGAAFTIYSGGFYSAYFARLSRSGGVLSGPTRVSYYGVSPAAISIDPDLAWSGSGFALTWSDSRNSGSTGYDIYATLLDASGAVAGGGTLHDLLIPSSPTEDDSPRIEYSPASGRYMIIWYRYLSGSDYQLYGAYLTPAGASAALANPLAGGVSATTFNVDLAPNGTGGFAAAWYDGRSAASNIYMARFTAWGVRLGADFPVTSGTTTPNLPFVTWTGAEYGVFYNDGVNDVWLQRVGADGTLQGGPLQLTFTGGNGFPAAAWGQKGYLLTFNALQNFNTTGANYSAPIACNGIGTPGCPGNPIAYSISGTSATLSWQAAQDYYDDIAYYRVYRNNAQIGTTADTAFTDGGLTIGTTYNFTFQAVNTAQNASSGCPAIYVKTNATLTLTMNKATPSDAGLNWTDAGFNNYNIFRGTSPQVMSQTGATPELSSTDPNALNDAVSYFYSVDNPGP